MFESACLFETLIGACGVTWTARGVPGHRALNAGGRLGGFSAHGGTVTKTALLAHEGVFADGGQRSLLQ